MPQPNAPAEAPYIAKGMFCSTVRLTGTLDMPTILLVSAVIIIAAFVGIKRYGGWKRWKSDIRAGLRKQREAGFLVTFAGYSGLFSAAGAIGIWAIYTAHDVLRWSNLGQLSWGAPVWAADVVYPASAVFFTLAVLSMVCLIQVVRRDTPNIPFAAAMTRNALWTPVFGLATVVAMVWRINEEQLSPLFWLYLLPVIAAILTSVWALLMLLLAYQAKRESTKQRELLSSGMPMAHSPVDLNEAIVVYLKKHPSSNSQECQDQFGTEALTSVQAIVDETMRIQIDWSEKSLVEIGEEIRAVMLERHPELSEAALKKLGNYFTYQVK